MCAQQDAEVALAMWRLVHGHAANGHAPDSPAPYRQLINVHLDKNNVGKLDAELIKDGTDHLAGATPSG